MKPTLPGWNMAERAARAEILAEQLAGILSTMIALSLKDYPRSAEAAQKSVAAWAEHLRQLSEQQGGR